MSLLEITRTCPDSIPRLLCIVSTSTRTPSQTQNAHAEALASLAASLALPAGATERVLVYSRELYYKKFTLEDNKTPRRDLQVKEVLETLTSLELRDWRFPYIDFVLYGILPDDPKEAAAIRRKAPMRSCKHCITDRMMEYYSDAFHIKRHRRHSKNLMTVCAEFTNLDLSSETGLEDLAIIG